MLFVRLEKTEIVLEARAATSCMPYVQRYFCCYLLSLVNLVVSPLVSLMVDQAGMKRTVGLWPKPAYIARLAAHFAQ